MRPQIDWPGQPMCQPLDSHQQQQAWGYIEVRGEDSTPTPKPAWAMLSVQHGLSSVSWTRGAQEAKTETALRTLLKQPDTTPACTTARCTQGSNTVRCRTL